MLLYPGPRHSPTFSSVKGQGPPGRAIIDINPDPCSACLAGLGLSSCAAAKPLPVQYGNPEGYGVHWLSGDSLSAQTVSINDLSLDTSSVEAINASVQAILSTISF